MRTYVVCRSAGFTLIEMSVVLMIIGLIIGAVAVGRDLIRSAELRAIVEQVGRYSAAINTFNVKYQQLPGDLRAADAAAFGFMSGNGTYGQGDGNGIVTPRATSDYACIQPVYGSAPVCNVLTSPVFSGMGEITYLWSQLSSAGLIEGVYDAAQTMATASAGRSFPLLKGRKASLGGLPFDTGILYFHSRDGDGPYLVLGAGTLTIPGPFSVGLNGPAFRPAEAYVLDSKLDDGRPLAGRVTGLYTIMGAINQPIVNAGGANGDSTSCMTTAVPGTSSYTFSHENRTCALSVLSR